MGDGETTLVPRLCHIVRWPDFNGYGFNLHAEKGKAGQFIGKIDEGSPAEAAGLKQGDRIVEVNGVNIGNENHQQVVGRIKAGGEETLLLVVDAETDQYYKEQKKVVKGDLPEVHRRSAKRDDTSPTGKATFRCSKTALFSSCTNVRRHTLVIAYLMFEFELKKYFCIFLLLKRGKCSSVYLLVKYKKKNHNDLNL